MVDVWVRVAVGEPRDQMTPGALDNDRIVRQGTASRAKVTYPPIGDQHVVRSEYSRSIHRQHGGASNHNPAIAWNVLEQVACVCIACCHVVRGFLGRLVEEARRRLAGRDRCIRAHAAQNRQEILAAQRTAGAACNRIDLHFVLLTP
jgi:hypothetical protein